MLGLEIRQFCLKKILLIKKWKSFTLLENNFFFSIAFNIISYLALLVYDVGESFLLLFLVFFFFTNFFFYIPWVKDGLMLPITFDKMRH